jgi:hypothetical protein
VSDGALDGAAVEAEPPLDRPAPDFEVISSEPVERAAAPTVSFRVRVTEPSAAEVYTIALTVLITIEPAKRTYDDATRTRLAELFGEPERWATTTTNFRWTQTDVLVPSFSGSAEFAVTVPCTYDLEVASSRYFDGLSSGDAPLRFHFNGTVLYAGENTGVQMLRVPWDRSARYAMPVDVWRRMIAEHYPFRSWMALDRDTLERLMQRKAERGLPTLDACVTDLLDGGGD